MVSGVANVQCTSLRSFFFEDYDVFVRLLFCDLCTATVQVASCLHFGNVLHRLHSCWATRSHDCCCNCMVLDFADCNLRRQHLGEPSPMHIDVQHQLKLSSHVGGWLCCCVRVSE